MILKLSLVFIFVSLQYVESGKNLQLEQSILQSIFSNYNPSIRPSSAKNESGPVIVEVNTFIRRINNIDDVKMTYDTQLTFRMSWMDERLVYQKGSAPNAFEYVTLAHRDQIWIPDFFFSNEESGRFHDMITPNTLIRIFPDGKVLFSTRISLRLFCSMAMRNYPMDSQVCTIRGASYGYTTEDIVFVWKKENPVELTKNLHMAKFSLYKFMTDYCTSRTSTGEYSCLNVNLYFNRNLFYYLQRAYMPTAALVILSWSVFWLWPRCVTLRLGIWIGLLMATMMVSISIGSTSPQVSYATALDMWMGGCVCFILSVLIEICLVINALKGDESMLLQNQIASDDSMADKLHMDDGKRRQVKTYTSLPLKWLNKYSTKAQRIDAISRILFPVAFAFFNFVYWVTYSAGR